MRRHRQLLRALGLSTRGVDRAWSAAHPGWPQTRATPPTPAPTPGPTAHHPAEAGPPPIEAPKNDLTWRDCTSRLFSDAGVAPITGVTLHCASYDADLDPLNGATGTLSIGVVKAQTTGMILEPPAQRSPPGTTSIRAARSGPSGHSPPSQPITTAPPNGSRLSTSSRAPGRISCCRGSGASRGVRPTPG